MAQKKLLLTFSPIEQQIINRVNTEFGFTAEEAECVKQIVEIIAQINSVKTRHRAIISLAARFPLESNKLMTHAVKLIWSLIAGLRTRQTMTQVALKVPSVQLN